MGLKIKELILRLKIRKFKFVFKYWKYKLKN